MITEIASKTFTTPLVREFSALATPDQLGSHESTMTLYQTGEPEYVLIEWDIPALEETVHIGVWFSADASSMTDYDGVMSLPQQAIELLEDNGIQVPGDFR